MTGLGGPSGNHAGQASPGAAKASPPFGDHQAHGRVPLTLEQITEIFNAGCRRGSDEATAFEWGSSTSGTREDDLADVLQEIANEGLPWGDAGRVSHGPLAKVWGQILDAIADTRPEGQDHEDGLGSSSGGGAEGNRPKGAQ